MYRKETHTQRYINWRSNHPKNCLLGVLKGLIQRAHTLCDMKEDLIDELELLHDVFIAQVNTVRKKDEEDYRDVIHAPYKGDVRAAAIRLE